MPTETTALADAIEAGTEAASDLVSGLPIGDRSWGIKEYAIAAGAAKAAAELLLWRLQHWGTVRRIP